MKNQTNLKSLSDKMLTENLTYLATREREVTADVIRHIHEFMTRKLYLGHGCTSIFSYLTTKLSYSGATAQSRIDAARLFSAAPDLDDDLASGAVNLTQVSVVAQALRQASKEQAGFQLPKVETQKLLGKIKNCDVKTSAVIVAKELNLEIKEREKVRAQKDESIRLEITLGKNEFEALSRVKDLTSHIQHDANWAGVISFLAKEYLKRKDPSAEKPTKKEAVCSERAFSEMASSKAALSETAPPQKSESSAEVKLLPKHELHTEVVVLAEPELSSTPSSSGASPKRKPLSIVVKREVAQRNFSCNEVVGPNGEKCGSTYQLQFDHIRPVCRGGGNEAENLQVLCAVHNRLKYRAGR